ncbi:30S ribosomal protein S20 [Anaerosalibacter massiliensis]|uniref:Small ribosomal subunit protein bS20 n=1 Tax=Anaerosalibacter massiliensis TaxID=1347392 RepID=A0A9X2S8C4_9FIRM|nr:30S ribosomal protein S20 [Anaerosalibacter massiliensis]MCR2044971.1 30S ribosomal protein S20 [Anaerosalibacter massiliensis]
MANIKSAKKRIGITQRKTEVNKMRKTEIKTYIKKFNEAIENNNFEEASKLLKVVDKKLKKATHKNTIHKNTASRKISQLTKKLNKAM